MSGVCGVVRYDGMPVTPEFLNAMAEKAPYRATHGVNSWIHGSVGLGFLTGQASSPRSAGLRLDERWVVVADSRLDNRADLLRHLEARECLRSETPSDVDLVVAALDCWGSAFCERLQGAYSIAGWDRSKSRLILVRDRLGERPLYWASTTQALFFASEPVQLLAEGIVDATPNLERALAYLTRQSFDPAWSFFRAIHRLPEGHFLLAQDGRVTLQRYWSLQASAVEKLSRSEAAEKLSHCLEQAVGRRLAGHTRAGVLLSGGLDSSSIAAKASALLGLRGEQLLAFTWQSQSGDKLDERRWSTALIDVHPNMVEHPVLADSCYPLSRYPEAYADPNAPDTNTYPDLLLTTIQAARKQGVDLLMNGIGGDPQIGGVLPELALLRQMRWSALAQRLRQSGWRSFRVLAGQIRAAFKTELPEWIASQGRRLAHQAGLDGPAPWTRELKSPLSLRAFLLAQPSNGLTLERFDRLSARHGIRIAAPWYDLDLVLLPLGVEDGALDQQPPGKSLLRQAMAGELPEKLLIDPVPKVSGSRLVAEGLVCHGRARIESWLHQSILGQLGLVDTSILLATYQQSAQSGRVMPGIWDIITLEIWLKLHYNKISQENGEQYQALPMEQPRR